MSVPLLGQPCAAQPARGPAARRGGAAPPASSGRRFEEGEEGEGGRDEEEEEKWLCEVALPEARSRSLD